MGGILSTVRTVVETIKSLLRDYEAVMKRISLSPGIPQLNSSVPYWTIPPSSIAQYGQDAELPEHADIVIIGSGITGSSIAKALLELSNCAGAIEPIKVVMIEARDACSGATGRNGGHASPAIYNEYARLKKRFGAAVTLQILQFRLAHITTLISVAKEEGLLEESQARIVDDFDAFLKPGLFGREKEKLNGFTKEVPKEMAENFNVIEERETIENLQLATSIVGLITKPGAAIHPYRLVTGILSNLLDRFSNFQLYTRTPCIGIETHNDSYIVSTPKGQNKAQHVIHAINAWSSHLLPGLRKKVVPFKVYMTAQRPGKGLSVSNSLEISKTISNGTSDWTGSRAFVFYPGDTEIGFDYLTQLRPSNPSNLTSSLNPTLNPDNNKTLTFQSTLPTAGEFMFGGGALLGNNEAAMMEAAGVSEDGSVDFTIEAYLSGSLPMYFKNWGKEDASSDTEASNPPGGKWGEGRVKAAWSGIMGLSADGNPWVGRVPSSVSKRQEPKYTPYASSGSLAEKEKEKEKEKEDVPAEAMQSALVAPGEWICAGYSGEGMVHAWLSGRALARMIIANAPDAKDDEPALPAPFIITEKRVKKANIEDVFEDR